MFDDIEFIRPSSQDAIALTGVKISRQAEMVDEGLLPPKIELGKRARAYIKHELAAVAAARAAGEPEDKIKLLVKALVRKRADWRDKLQIFTEV